MVGRGGVFLKLRGGATVNYFDKTGQERSMECTEVSRGTVYSMFEEGCRGTRSLVVYELVIN